MTKTWKELEAEGVRRCCVMFTSGKRCRRRCADAFKGEWCSKHGPVMKRHADEAIKAINAQRTADDREGAADDEE